MVSAEVSTQTDPAWLAKRRERAAALLAKSELPRWKGAVGWEFTDLGSFSLDRFAPLGPNGRGAETAGDSEAGDDFEAAGDFETVITAPAEATVVTQVDGSLAVVAGGGSDDQVIVMSLARAAEEHPELVEAHLGRVVESNGGDIFTNANEAQWSDGLFVYVRRGHTVAAPIVLNAVSAAPNGAQHRRVLIILEEGAEAEIWEQSLSVGDEVETLQNTVVELVVGQNARLHYLSLQELNEKSWVFGNHRAEVARDGVLDWAALAFGSATGRIRMETLLAGEGAEARVTGAYAPHARQHIDFDTTQEHGAPNTRSDLAFRGILADRSRAVWRGMIKVDVGAQKTDAFQECRNLLLSKRAHADAIPGLEILANDVRCTHAAAIAQIDREQLFYLRSRGLGEGIATQLVIEGFMSELVERFPKGAVREALADALNQRLALLLT